VRHVEVNQVQGDEAWAFMGTRDKHCDPSDPGDRERGSYWDHVLIDADSRVIVTLVIGRRDTETARQAFADFYRRTDGDLTPLITSQRSRDQSELDALNEYPRFLA
jgi:hypothetical protein